ncbi:hypothetical protein Hanom_Chr15g01373121 [Helianthus anomalus]
MQNWPIPRPTFKLAPTTLYSTTWCHCHPGVKKTLTLFVYFADVAFNLMWHGEVATGLSVLAGAALLKSVMDQNPMMSPGSGSGQFPRCSSCNGTGRVSCLCNRGRTMTEDAGLVMVPVG